MLNTKNFISTVENSIYDEFNNAAKSFPNEIALKASGGQGKSYSYQETLELVESLAAGLQTGRLASCQQIGLLSENRPEWVITYLAIVSSGKTVVPIDANLKPNEISYILGHASLTAVFISSRFDNLMTDLVENVIACSFDTSNNNWQHEMADRKFFKPKSSPEKLASLIYTSGTTGAPKAVMLTHRNLVANLTSIRKDLQFGSEDVFLSVLPLHHTFETTCGFLTPLTSGSTVVYARSLKSREIIEDIKYNRVTIMIGVPLLYEKMYQSIQRSLASVPKTKQLLFKLLSSISAIVWSLGQDWGKVLFASLRKKAGLKTVRLFVSGGAAIPPYISKFFNIIGFSLIQGYGMTECSPVISANRPDYIQFGSVGPPVSDIEVMIDNPDSVGIGEIIVRGANVTQGYKDNAKETSKLLINGWLHTGDLGRMHKGHLWITGRRKNLIVSAAGKNIYPEEIEEKIIRSTYILEVVVFGRPKKGKQGEEVCSIIVPNLEAFSLVPDCQPDKKQKELIEKKIDKIITELNSQMADYKRVSSIEVSYDELEKTSTKKVKRYVYNH